jgi:hypothetical protein
MAVRPWDRPLKQMRLWTASFQAGNHPYKHSRAIACPSCFIPEKASWRLQEYGRDLQAWSLRPWLRAFIEPPHPNVGGVSLAIHAPVVELVDALDSKSSSERSVGSSPTRGTIFVWRSTATRAGSLNARIAPSSRFWFESRPLLGTIFVWRSAATQAGSLNARIAPSSRFWFESRPVLGTIFFVSRAKGALTCEDFARLPLPPPAGEVPASAGDGGLSPQAQTPRSMLRACTYPYGNWLHSFPSKRCNNKHS